jgi:hypothetical protein
MKRLENKIGEERLMNCGELALIVEYNNNLNVKVKFKKTGEITKCRYNDFLNGEVKSHYSPTVCGVGIVGKETTTINGKKIKSYACWKGMLKRCYDNKFKLKYPTYKDVTCCDEWLYYKNFKEWYSENYYEIEGEKMDLEKDILVKGNKVYSPETCLFVPHRINEMFVKNNIKRGHLPIGVMHNKKRDKYRVQCNDGNGNQVALGFYLTIEEAFNVYKQYKETLIKRVADFYKDQIPYKLYEAMYNWKVEITD